MPRLDKRELATVLAALRYWQRTSRNYVVPEDIIADDGGELIPLSVSEIDTLCERLNFGDAS